MDNCLTMGLAYFAVVYVIVLVCLAAYVLLGLWVPYLLVRARDRRSEHHDPQIGIKAALYFFYSLALLVLLNGLMIVVLDMMQVSQLPPAQRPVPFVNPGVAPA